MAFSIVMRPYSLVIARKYSLAPVPKVSSTRPNASVATSNFSSEIACSCSRSSSLSRLANRLQHVARSDRAPRAGKNDSCEGVVPHVLVVSIRLKAPWTSLCDLNLASSACGTNFSVKMSCFSQLTWLLNLVHCLRFGTHLDLHTALPRRASIGPTDSSVFLEASE